MAAANTDKLRKLKSRFSTTLNGSIDDDDETIALSSASGLATDTAVTLTIDRVDSNGVSTPSKIEVVTGVISGNNLTNVVRGEDGTTAQAHDSGAVVEYVWNGDIYNDMVDWGLVELGQDGVLSDRVGADDGILTGTAGTDTYVPKWNSDGDLVDGYAFLDENDMSSDSATSVASQQSIKAYVDSFLTSAIEFVIDGGGSEITTGIKGDLEIPFACTIDSVTMLADQSGSIVVDIWKDTYANFPPTDADSITASAVPTISTATKSQDATLTGWTASITAGDTLRFNVDSVTDIERVTISLKVTKS